MREILITNDDGFDADGLLILASEIKKIPDTHVTIIAPSSQKSASSHSLSVTKPLSFIKISDDFYKLDDATPADCVLLGLDVLFSKKPDLIISGINCGGNLAEDITYSGTCGGAMEAVLHGVNAIAFSQVYFGDSLQNFGYEISAKFSKILVEKFLNEDPKLGERKFLNVNFPPCSMKDFKGFCVVPAGFRSFTYGSQRNVNPRGREYFWIDSDSLDFDIEKNRDKDLGKIFENYATITPIMLNLTDFSEIKKVEKWLK